MKKISVIGLGYVGLPMFSILSNVKKNKSYLYEVHGIEKNNKIGDFIKYCFKNKKIWINDSSDKTFIKYLKNSFNRSGTYIRTDFEKLSQSDIIIVSINFEIKNSLDETFLNLKKLSKDIAQNVKRKALVIFESTLPPGTSDRIILPIFKNILKKRNLKIKDIYFSYSFERVMPGENYIKSITENHRCYSGINKESKEKCKNFLKTFINIKKFKLYELKSITECEATKILENSYRAINISLIDEWTKISNFLKIDVFNMVNAIKLRKTHSNIMRPGIGVGGYCLTKDPNFINYSLKNLYKKKFSFPIISSAMKVNFAMVKTSFNYIKNKLKFLKNKKILICGLSYKSDTSDTRYSSSLELIKILKKNGSIISVLDPYINNMPKKNFNNLKIVNRLNGENYKAIIFCTPHKQFKKIKIKNIKKNVKIFDLDYCLTQKQIKNFKKKNFEINILGSY